MNALVLSGGGVRGILSLGAIAALELDTNKVIDVYAGSSIGSVICLLLSINYQALDIFTYANEKVVEISDIDLRGIINNYGLIKTTKLENLLKELLIKKGIDINVTFTELFELTNKTVIVTCHNCSTNKSEYISHKNKEFCNVRVVDALVASCSIPFVFPSKIITGESGNVLMIDGGVNDHMPLGYTKEHYPEHKVYCISTMTQLPEGNPKNIWEFIYRTISCTHYDRENNKKRMIAETDVYISITLDTPRSYDFAITPSEQLNAFVAGYTYVKNLSINQFPAVN